MKLKLKKDIVIPRNTVFEDDGVIAIEYAPTHTTYRFPKATKPYETGHVSHVIAFGKNATGDLRIMPEVGDKEFDKYFEKIN